MKIAVKDPTTGTLWKMEGSGFFITNRSGTWQSGDDHHVEPELLINIGLALEGHEPGEQIINH